ncbi:hypothetical protein ACH3XW_6250 [Acanthocheilonema viteae]
MVKTDKDTHKDVKKSGKEKPAEKKLNKSKVSNEPLSNNMLKKTENEQLSVKTSLLETSKMIFNIVEITQDSTMYSQKSSNNNIINQCKTIAPPLSKNECNTDTGTLTETAKIGPFAVIKENILKKQRDFASVDESEDALPS